MIRPLSGQAVRFRTRIIDALDHFEYVNADTCVGACPVCDGVLGVRFHGTAPRADLTCHAGCDERDVAAAIGRLAPKATA